MLGLFNSKKENKVLTEQLENQAAKYNNLESQFINFQQEVLFDGQKQTGELGPPITIWPDYYAARERAWELNLTNDIAKLVVNKWTTWLIGKGLRFNATPPRQEYLQTTDRKKLISQIEFRFRNYMKSKHADYSGMLNFHGIAKNSTYNSIVSGDVLRLSRVENGNVTTQLLDGANLVNPLNYTGSNIILDGVEMDKKGKHIAFWVDIGDLKTKRVTAIHEPTGLKMASMIYGSKFRLNETRGIPLLLENFEKIKNLEKYIDATVKLAQISSEMILVNEHNNSSTGENIFKNAGLKAINATTTTALEELPAPKCFQRNLAKSTKGTAINNTIGGTLKMIKPDAEATMPDFLKTNLQVTFASAEIPYEVAMSVYGSNYSASKAARNDWQHVLDVKTESVASQQYQPVYELWLYNEVVSGKIVYPELLDAYARKDIIMIAALNSAIFTGVSVGDIDPLKTVKAVRAAMGDDKTPIMTGERGAEIVSQMDFGEVQEQVDAERKIAAKPINNEDVITTGKKTTE
jgi:capsid protein